MGKLTSFLNIALNYILFRLFDQRNMLYFYKNDKSVIKLPSIKHLYSSCRGASIEFLYYSELTKELHFRTADGIRAVSNDYFHIFIEIFCAKIYCSYEDYIRKEFVLIDAGANRGYSALYFAKNDFCQRVYSYEPDKDTFAYLQKNRVLNPQLSGKIVANNVGLSDSDDILTFYHHGKTDGINSTDADFLTRFDKKRKSEMVPLQITVKKASAELAEIIKLKSGTRDIFLKIDIEGAEYAVLADLKTAGLLESVYLVFGECHNGFSEIMNICGDTFECVFLNTCRVKGLYNFIIKNKNL